MSSRSFSWLAGAGVALLIGVACSAPKPEGPVSATGVAATGIIIPVNGGMLS